MATLNIGTRVRLLNEVGEGVVSGMDRSGKVLVMMDDGFEIPYLSKELVVVGLSEQAPASVMTATSEAGKLKELLYLSFSLEGMLKEPNIGVRLINRRKESLFVALYGEEDKYLKLDSTALLPAGSAKLVMTGVLSTILKRDRFLIQLLPLPSETSSIPVYWAGYVKHQVPAMADPSGWPMLEVLAQRGLLFEVYPLLKHENVAAPPNKDAINKTPEIKKNWLLRETKDGIFEVDLHIHELLESTSGMDNFQIINFQVRHFEKCVDEARLRSLKRFVVIHGVGKGRLKDELSKWLKAEGFDFYDASFKNYGYGAMEIRVR